MRAPRDLAQEVRQSLVDPVGMCRKLGWLKGSQRQSRGVIIRCPSHGEKNASCAIRVGSDGTIQAKCFSCGFAGDALSLLALAYGLTLKTNFREVLAIGAELAGNLGLADEIRGDTPSAKRPKRKPPPARKWREPMYLTHRDIAWFFKNHCIPVDQDVEVSNMLIRRAINPADVDRLRLARAIRPGAALPPWASHKGFSWSRSGHRLIMPAWDCLGRPRSLRAWRVRDGATPKRLPPSGVKGTGLVLCNRPAMAMLRGVAAPRILFIAEGEPDMLTIAYRLGRDDDTAVLGIGSGSWSEDFAGRIPAATRVIICTHGDRAGDNYAADIRRTTDRPLERLRPDTDINDHAVAGTLTRMTPPTPWSWVSE